MKYINISCWLFLLFMKFYTYAARIVAKHPICKQYRFIQQRIQKCLNGSSSCYMNPKLQNKNLLSLSPGGFKGFYVMGVITYIKQHYNLSNYIFSGASAGAWNALVMSYRGDPMEIYDLLFKELELFQTGGESVLEMEQKIKKAILGKFQTTDFDLEKLFIGVTTLHNFSFGTSIISDFTGLEDALDACIASSHIPFITGGLFSIKYNNIYMFDGGFSKYPYLNIMEPILHITPGIWENPTPKRPWLKTSIEDYTTLFSRDKYNFKELFHQGYEDTKKNRIVLDEILFS